MIEAFLNKLIDYAGIFPPAALSMTGAVENYYRYRSSSDAWMLGKFVVPVGKLSQFRDVAGGLVTVDAPWDLSVLLPAPVGDGRNFRSDLEILLGFREQSPAFNIDSIETRLDSLECAASCVDELPHSIRTFWEVAIDSELKSKFDWLISLKGRHAAKIRTGGLEPGAIPSLMQVATFLEECAGRGLAFKATAGLHHPLRNDYCLTYEPDSPRATMFGFLNVFAAALLAKVHGWTAPQIMEVLASRSITDFSITDQGIGWGKWFVASHEIELMREQFATSFGSCSFEEPTAELRQLGILPIRQLA